MKQKLGTIAERTKGIFLDELDVTQFAFERIAANLEKFAKAHNANGQLLKDAQLQLAENEAKLRNLQQKARKA